MPLYTQQQPSKSLADRLFAAEFDDALVDQIAWKNSRYDGCKVISKEINKYTPQQTTLGGIGTSVIVSASISSSFGTTQAAGFQIGTWPPQIDWIGDTLNPSGLNPNVKRETTALYISNTVIGGEEDTQFATIKNHSYVNINQILLIDPTTDETQLINKQSEDFTAFHSFVTNDLPTGESFSIKVIDESIAQNLKGPNEYKVKMNKGFLLKTFDFKYTSSLLHLTENNSLYLYKKGTTQSDMFYDGVKKDPLPHGVNNREIVRFRYGTIEMIGGGGAGEGSTFALDRIGPSFISSSIIENKFTQQYYSGSYGFINEASSIAWAANTTNGGILKSSGLGSASRFIGVNTLNYLNNHPNTELHLTLFDGTKDFSISETNTSSAHDERSISTFEVDNNQSQLDIGGICNDFLPKTHELRLKGVNDSRFEPKGHTYFDDFQTAYVTGSVIVGGCIVSGSNTPALVGSYLQRGINVDKVTTASVFVQGGEIGVIGYQNVQSGSHPQYGKSLSGSMSGSNYYSGSFDYQLSFLDKDHTLITNLNKNAELFDGIGSKGIIIIPKNIHKKIKNNLQFYLQQAGIIDSSPNTQIELTDDIN